MAYSVIGAGDLEWLERPALGGDGAAARRSTSQRPPGSSNHGRGCGGCPPRTRGRRHVEGAQEEVFVVLEGTLTLLLGEPPERFDLGPTGVASVSPGSAIQVRNETDAEVTFLAYGAPPVEGQAEIIDDVEL